MREITLDCRGFVPRSEVHRVFAEALAFPDHYGNNLDALHDCLTSLPEETKLTLLHWEATQEGLGRYALGLKRVLTDSEEENPMLHIQFA